MAEENKNKNKFNNKIVIHCLTTINLIPSSPYLPYLKESKSDKFAIFIGKTDINC